MKNAYDAGQQVEQMENNKKKMTDEEFEIYLKEMDMILADDELSEFDKLSEFGKLSEFVKQSELSNSSEFTEPSEFHCLNKDLWEELSNRTIGATGNCYIGKEYIPDKEGQTYEIRVFVKKIKRNWNQGD